MNIVFFKIFSEPTKGKEKQSPQAEIESLSQMDCSPGIPLTFQQTKPCPIDQNTPSPTNPQFELVENVPATRKGKN